MSDAEIEAANAAIMRRDIMGRVLVVVHELDQIDGNLDDLPKPRDGEIDVRLTKAQLAASRLRDLLLERGWR